MKATLFVAALCASAAAGPYDVITRSSASAGIMQLGSLYHAGTEQAVPGLICEPEVVAQHTRTEDTGNFMVKFEEDDHFSAKAKLMDVSGWISIKINLLIASAQVTFGMGYMTDKRTTLRQVRVSLKTETRTQSEFFDAFAPEVVNAAPEYALTQATHVVTGVVWGQRNIGVFESTARTLHHIKNVYLNLKATAKILGVQATIFEKRFDIIKEDFENVSSSSVSLFSDFLPAKYPESRQELMNSISDAIASLNETGARGVPLSYTLTPLAVLRPSAETKLVWDISDSYVEEAQRVIDALEEGAVAIADLRDHDSEGHKMWAKSVDQYTRDFTAWQAAFAYRLGRAMTEVRSNAHLGANSTAESIPSILAEYWDGRYTAERIDRRVRELRAEIERYLSYVDALRPKGVQIAKAGGDIHAVAANPASQEALALLLVDHGPRDDVAAVKAFADYALRRVRPGAPPCIERVHEGGGRFCHERIDMIAAHFDSHCSTLCPAAFCPLQSAPAGRPVCKAVHGGAHPCVGNGTESTEGGCWRRPPADGFAGGDAALSGFVTAEWCACPHTIVVDLKSGTPVTLPVVPEPPVSVTVAAGAAASRASSTLSGRQDPVAEADPFARAAVLRVVHDGASGATPGDVRVLRYIVRVLYDAATAPGGTDYHTVADEFGTADASEDILVTGLQAGRRYVFEVAAVNRVGAGPFSRPFPVDGPVQLAAIVSTVRYVGARGGPGGAAGGTGAGGEGEGADGAQDFPAGAVPSWPVAGGTSLALEIRTSSPMRRPVAEVSFRDDASGATLACESLWSPTVDGALCTLPVAALAAVLPDLTADAEWAVTVTDAMEESVEGTFTFRAPSRDSCATFEPPGRAMLCEARVASVVVLPPQADPLDQAAAVEVYAAGYPRSVNFSGWRVDAVAADGHRVRADRPRGAAGPSELRIGGLRAGAVYRFYLSARHFDGTALWNASAAPADGLMVHAAMPTITPRGGGARNRLPGWRAFGDGQFEVEIVLTQAAPAPIAAVVFGGAAQPPLHVDVFDANASHARAVLSLAEINDGGFPGLYGGDVPVAVLGVSGAVVAAGVVVRDPISGAACQEWDPLRPLHCDLEDPDTARCVDACHACGTTHQVGKRCVRNQCGAHEVLCVEARDLAAPCVPRSTGCALCNGATLTTVAGREACRPPCVPMAGRIVPPGATHELTCPPGYFHSTGAPPAAPAVFACPVDNTQRYPVDPATGVRAAWAAGVQAPVCSQCTVQHHCNGGALSVSSDANRTACLCTCKPGYEGPMCGTCAPGFYRASNGDCRQDGLCDMQAYSVGYSVGGQCSAS
eukprot:TRINITY_DN4790_c0_g3_i1.p1 TRINITY_DN4790_c0_g3~~TRINITY_DN4790_c0_g3_i1.p1  ORF type:complete len:1318 (+),score=318.04 TRINITY_DN4790_c0_g3_i1:136-4089(+)